MKHYQIVLDVLEYIHKNNYYPYDKVEIAISALSLNEKRLTTYILMETLRKTVLIDYVLSEFLSNPGKLPGKILNILRIGTMQILFSENYTNRKIVNDMVDLVSNERFKKLVNAVLRKVSKAGRDFSGFPENVKYSHPLWLYREIRKNYKKSYLDVLMENTMKPDFTYKFSGDDEELEKNGYDFIPGLEEDSITVFEKGNRRIKLQRIDPVLNFLKSEFDLPVFRVNGSRSGLICEKPWLLNILNENKIRNISYEIKKSVDEIEENEFIYYNTSFISTENGEILKNLRGYKVIRVKISKMNTVNDELSGNYIIGNQTLRPSYFAVMRKING